MEKQKKQRTNILTKEEQTRLTEKEMPKPYNDISLSVLQNKEIEMRVVFVDNIAGEATKKEVYRFFKDCGKIKKIWIKSGEEKKKNCFLLFDKEESVNVALLNKNRRMFRGRHLRVVKAGEMDIEYPKMILIADLPVDADEEELKEVFDQFDEVDYIRVLRQEDSPDCNGFGYVKFLRIPRFKILVKEKLQYKKQVMRILKVDKNLFKEKELLMNPNNKLETRKALLKLKENTEEMAKMKNTKEQSVNPIELKRVHTGKVPNSILSRKIKKMRKKRGMTGVELAENAAKLQQVERKKLNKEYLLKDDLLKERRELRKKKKMYNKLAARKSQK